MHTKHMRLSIYMRVFSFEAICHRSCIAKYALFEITELVIITGILKRPFFWSSLRVAGDSFGCCSLLEPGSQTHKHGCENDLCIYSTCVYLVTPYNRRHHKPTARSVPLHKRTKRMPVAGVFIEACVYALLTVAVWKCV